MRSEIEEFREAQTAVFERQARVLAALRWQQRRIPGFLSHRFDAPSERVAHEISSFLETLGVRVVTGRRYEPRRVSDKVAELIDGIEFVVALITASGASTWIRDEMTRAHANGTPIVPFVERGQTFEAGIFGDHEVVFYEVGHPGDGFHKLAEAVEYVRAQPTPDSEIVAVRSELGLVVGLD